MDILLTTVFFFEICLKLTASSEWWTLAKRFSFQVDVVSVIVTTAILIPGIYQSYVYKYLTCFQIIRFHKTAKMTPRIPKIIVSSKSSR
jgi:hypothetical protein